MSMIESVLARAFKEKEESSDDESEDMSSSEEEIEIPNKLVFFETGNHNNKKRNQLASKSFS